MTSRQIRCKKCGHWNQLNHDDQQCSNCKSPLIEVSASEVASLERRKTAGELTVKILESDAWYTVIFKKIYNAVTLVFISIIAFFLWLFAASPG
ncbi:MAG: hypothetical protein KDC13_07495 [Bacteroidetes bacterium]|nr:hypothetical protein [Bacteroidota bacterium]